MRINIKVIYALKHSKHKVIHSREQLEINEGDIIRLADEKAHEIFKVSGYKDYNLIDFEIKEIKIEGY